MIAPIIIINNSGPTTPAGAILHCVLFGPLTTFLAFIAWREVYENVRDGNFDWVPLFLALVFSAFALFYMFAFYSLVFG
jgi:hypothetical protein